MDWNPLPLTEFTRIDRLFAVKVALTAVDTYIQDSHRDENIRLDLHVTTGGRFVGYTLKGRQTKTKPLVLVRPMFVSLFYTDPKVSDHLPMSVMYHDYNVRLLSFGEGSQKDYLMVLRSKQESGE